MMSSSTSGEVIRFPTKRKAAYRSSPVRIADYPENVVSLGIRRAERQESWRAQPDNRHLPELAQSPELALIIAMYAAIPAKTRKRATRELLSLAWRNGGSGVAAPSAAYALVNRLNLILDKERGR